jgi:hypothetical protein
MTIFLQQTQGNRYAEYYDSILSELPGCTAAMLDQNIIQVARDFCERTNAWQLDLDPINSIAGLATYPLTFPDDSEITRIYQIDLNGVLLWRFSDREKPGETITVREPKYPPEFPPFTLTEHIDSIVLGDDEVPTESQTGGLLLKAAFQPTIDANALPDFLFVHHGDDIRMGVLGRMMIMKKPWRDDKLGADYRHQYDDRTNFVAYQATVGNTRQRLRVKKWG